MSALRVPCAGAVVFDEQGRLLMIQRGKEPDKGCWSLPGGRLEPGESYEQACAREVLEETGLSVVVGEPVGEVELPLPGQGTALVRDFRCAPSPGEDPADVRAADDAADIGWFSREEISALRTSPGLLPTLVSWGVLAEW